MINPADHEAAHNGGFAIGNRRIGYDQDIFVLGEVANAHDGSYNTAHAYVEAVAKAGADAVKFQTHIADAETTPREEFRVKFSRTDKTRFDYWKRMEFSKEQWIGLKQHVEERGMVFLSSPFSAKAVELLESIGIAAWKVGSGETNNYPLVELMAGTGKPMFISTGMSYWHEIDRCVEICTRHGAPYVLFHCTTAYPCPPERIGLNVIGEFLRRYRCPVGFSDHSGDIITGLAAAALGVSALEVHVALSRDSFGPDVPASVVPTELKHLIEGTRVLTTIRRNPVAKDRVAKELEPLRKLFNKSVVYEADLPAGTVLTEKNLAGKKPGDGIEIARIGEFIGRKLKRAVARNQPLSPDDLA